MKIYKIVLTVLIPIFFGSFRNISEITVKGRLVGKIVDRVEYTIPDNGNYNWVLAESTKVDSLGNFQFVVKSDKPVFIKLKVNLQTQGIMIAEPGKSYNVLFNVDNGKGNFQVLDGNEMAQNAYNKFNPSFDPYMIQLDVDCMNYLKDTSALSIKEKITKREETDIAKFKGFLEKGEISNGFFQLMKADRECYYATLQAIVVYLKQERAARTNGQFPNDMKNLWIETFQNPLFERQNITQSPWFYTYCMNYIYYKKFMNNDINQDKYNQLVKDGLLNTFYISEAKKYLPPQLQENYIADYIYLISSEKGYEKELITLFNQFKENYPKSNYTKSLLVEIDENVKFHRAAEKEFSEKMKFLEGYQNMNDLKAVISSLKGKKVYVDVWATWCHSCREEFAYREELYKLLKAKGVTMLYISVDEDYRDKQWKDLIKFYNLEGYHVRVNKNLYSDLRKIYNPNGGIAIPWYLIYDENGNVRKLHAKSPKDIIELEKELNEI